MRKSKHVCMTFLSDQMGQINFRDLMDDEIIA